MLPEAVTVFHYTDLASSQPITYICMEIRISHINHNNDHSHIFYQQPRISVPPPLPPTPPPPPPPPPLLISRWETSFSKQHSIPSNIGLFPRLLIGTLLFIDHVLHIILNNLITKDSIILKTNLVSACMQLSLEEFS